MQKVFQVKRKLSQIFTLQEPHPHPHRHTHNRSCDEEHSGTCLQHFSLGTLLFGLLRWVQRLVLVELSCMSVTRVVTDLHRASSQFCGRNISIFTDFRQRDSRSVCVSTPLISLAAAPVIRRSRYLLPLRCRLSIDLALFF